MKKILIFALSFIFIISSFVGCKSENNFDNGKLTVAVSIPPQAEFVKAVCGDSVNMIILLPAGASPETYEPSVTDLKDLEFADIYFSIGVAMEENSILPALSKNTKNIELHKSVAKHYPELFEGEDSHRDPHIWLSIKRAKIMVEEIKNEIITLDTKNAEKYKKNAKNYIKKLEEADTYIKELFETKQSRKFIVYHPAFAYFADEYSLSMYALEEHGKEITAKRMSQMIDFAKKENIGTIFYSQENSNKLPETFAKEIGAKAVMLSPLAENYLENIKTMATTISKAMK